MKKGFPATRSMMCLLSIALLAPVSGCSQSSGRNVACTIDGRLSQSSCETDDFRVSVELDTPLTVQMDMCRGGDIIGVYLRGLVIENIGSRTITLEPVDFELFNGGDSCYRRTGMRDPDAGVDLPVDIGAGETLRFGIYPFEDTSAIVESCGLHDGNCAIDLPQQVDLHIDAGGRSRTVLLKFQDAYCWQDADMCIFEYLQDAATD